MPTPECPGADVLAEPGEAPSPPKRPSFRHVRFKAGKGQLELSVISDGYLDTLVRLYDAYGRSLSDSNVALYAGRNDLELSLPLALKPGSYFVTLEAEGRRTSCEVRAD